MTLIQGVINALVLFLSRVLAFVVSQALRTRDDRDSGGWLKFLLVIVFQIVFSILGSVVVCWWEPEPSMVAHILPLLASRELFAEALRVLRRGAYRVTGQLVDALLDPRTVSVVRRRIPRVLKVSPTRRATVGLLAALQDESFDVRNAAALALAALTDRSAALAVPRDEVFTLTRLALENPRGGERTLPHVFTLLALTLEREPLRLCWGALNGHDQRSRGTALEYLQNVVPDDLRRPLWGRLGAQWSAAPARPQAEVVEELLHSSKVHRPGRPPWRVLKCC